ncbi:MAG: CDP-glycerol glycerophosphotransferase family protein [Actinobacteria bacterium]|nr:CDP-glycerol glycerophosphotransferase family protein [Actinomycetota bacterium]
MAADGFSFAAGNLRQLLSAPRYLLGGLRARRTDRDRNTWVFGSAFGVADGGRAFADAALALPDPPRVVWLAGSDEEAADAAAAGYDVVERDGSAGLDATLSAGLIAITHGFGDVNRFGVSGAVIVQLWHGAPLKRLHADSPAVVGAGPLGRVPGMPALMRWAYRRGSQRISLLPVSSPFFQPFMRSAFHLTDQVRVLGEPRTDVLFTGDPASAIAASRALLSRHLGELGDRRIVLFAPTWRDGRPDPSIPTPREWEAIEAFCSRHDAIMVIRPHPLGVGAYQHTSDRVRLLSPAMQRESMPLLWGVSALIADYSSILIDYAATGRPIVLLAPDLDHYRRTRGLYVDYPALAGEGLCTTWEQTLAKLDRLFTDPVRLAASVQHSYELARLFHTYTDGRSAQRVAEAAAALVRERFGS